MHNIELEIKEYSLAAKGDSSVILSGTLRIDARHTIGHVTDEYLYLDLTGKEMIVTSPDREGP